MSPVTVERVATGNANPEFYAGAPVLSAYHSAVLKLMPPASQVAPNPHVVVMVHRRHPRWMRHEVAEIGRTAWQYAKARYIGETQPGGFVFGSFEMTGPTSQRVLDLVDELASRPRSYSVVSRQPAEVTEFALDPEHVTEAASAEQAHSFLSNAGGRIAFSDLEVSSDDDLIEAGFPYYSHAEDPGLAAESRRNFLNRIGLGSM